MVILLLAAVAAHECVHDDFAQDAPKHFLNDLTDHRLLAPAEDGRYTFFLTQDQNIRGLYPSDGGRPD